MHIQELIELRLLVYIALPESVSSETSIYSYLLQVSVVHENVSIHVRHDWSVLIEETEERGSSRTSLEPHEKRGWGIATLQNMMEDNSKCMETEHSGTPLRQTVTGQTVLSFIARCP